MTKYSVQLAVRLGQALALVLLISHSTTPFAKEIYKSVDKNGNVTYSDTKTDKQAESVKLPAINTQPAVKPTFKASQNREQEAPNYQIYIVNPQNGETLHNNQRSINVDVSLSPALEYGFYLQTMLDGTPHGAAATTTRLTVGELERGEHTLSVAVVDSNGNIFSQSSSITLYVKRPSLNSPTRKAKAQN